MKRIKRMETADLSLSVVANSLSTPPLHQWGTSCVRDRDPYIHSVLADSIIRHPFSSVFIRHPLFNFGMTHFKSDPWLDREAKRCQKDMWKAHKEKAVTSADQMVSVGFRNFTIFQSLRSKPS